ncbi:sulfurtransferase [Schaalia sp. 19OD2882]|uniref:sulfurtransferase n=1 Tax=Schaalia sp. 19OD2882 TaxID=2794089 RepID=UPI001C1E9646|nr:sulfurtransferase [Schaalia sp. 19OD2882]QWW20232.1 sulfurtransferase [Schaalia sp. 19OD2882]
MDTASPSPLVDAVELSALLAGDPGSRPVVLDVRYPGPGSPVDGHAQYLQGHVPGAAYLDMDTALAAPHVPGVTGRHPLPEVEVLQAALRAAGVSAGRPVVVYDDWKSIAAARAWWLLLWAGHEDVRVLDGGWRAWRAGGGAVEGGEVVPVPGDVTVRPGGRRVVEAQGAARIAETGVLLDARPANRFRGEDETIDPVAGHIPGARSLPALELVDETGRFLPAAELAAKFEAVGAAPGVEVGLYCGSGIQACHAALAGAASGILADPVLYASSWSGWVTDADRPVALG